MTNGIVRANGVDLAYFRGGEGPPVLVVGWAGFHEMFPSSL